MEALIFDWASLLARWLHVVAGIAWIGSSFYFIWLDLSLKPGKRLPDGVQGDSWSVHGGGFYYVQKYLVAPDNLPKSLKWFKHEAYVTWISGFALLVLLYYWQADAYLINRSVADLSPRNAIMISLGFLVAGWIIYDLICRSPLGDNTALLGSAVVVLILAFSYGLEQLFSGRAAFLHVGAIIGGMMVGNVFFIIIPNQKKIVTALLAGEAPDPALGQQSKQRSIHNNYLTLPVVLMMVSSHYPMLYATSSDWIVVAFLLAIGGVVRDWFNADHAGLHGKRQIWQWPLATLLMLGMIAFVSWERFRPLETSTTPDSADIQAIIQARCLSCHAAQPSDEDFDAPPADLEFSTLEVIRANAPRIMAQAVSSEAMPLGNKTAMTAEERDLLGQWIRAGAP